MIAEGEEEEGRMDWEPRISRGKLFCKGWINNKAWRYSTGNYILYPVIDHNAGTSRGPVVKTSSSNAVSVGSVPGWGAKIPHAFQPKNQNTEQKQYCYKFNKDFKNGPIKKRRKEYEKEYI